MIALWLATGVIAETDALQPPTFASGGASRGNWWRRYRPLDLTKKEKEEIIEEIVEAVSAETSVTETGIRAEYNLSMLSGIQEAMQKSLIQEAVSRINAEIARRIEEEDEEVILLN